MNQNKDESNCSKMSNSSGKVTMADFDQDERKAIEDHEEAMRWYPVVSEGTKDLKLSRSELEKEIEILTGVREQYASKDRESIAMIESLKKENERTKDNALAACLPVLEDYEKQIEELKQLVVEAYPEMMLLKYKAVQEKKEPYKYIEWQERAKKWSEG